MQFAVTILGANAAVPANHRHPTAQVLQVHEQGYLIDCGEGTQIRMNDYHIRRNKINQIFISHLHGDHIFGLLPLLTSYSLNGRTEPFDIFGPAGIREIIEVQLKHTQSHLSYSLNIHIVDPTIHQQIFADDHLMVETIPLKHRVPATGYLFREQPRPLNIDPEKIKTYQIPVDQIRAIKAGGDFKTSHGQIIDNQELTLPPYHQRTYAFCSDTAYHEPIIPIIEEVDLLYHEATFTEEKAANAIKTGHSTARQAAMIAQAAKVKKLIIGHYSSRYLDLVPLREEAQQIFTNTALAIEGETYTVALRRKLN